MAEDVFLFACCQAGAEPVLKRELGESHPAWRFAFSRPGFVTFKWTGGHPPAPRLQLKSVFARCHGWSLGPIHCDSMVAEGWADVVNRVPDRPIQGLHVWQRHLRRTATGMPYVVTDQTTEFGQQIARRLVQAGRMTKPIAVNQPVRTGQCVVDVIMVNPDEWWLGWHQVGSYHQRWPGGVPRLRVPKRVVSRAYFKMQEAIMWSQIPIHPGDLCIELGSAPGGASQALLEAGLHIMGVDPAEMDDQVLANPHFVHVRKRGADVKRREYRGYQWLVADSNVAPGHTLDTVESIVSHRTVDLRGMLLTLKLLNWELAGEIAEYARRVRSWGYQDVRCRQLACNQQEVCLAAIRSRGIRRSRRFRQRGQAARE